MLTKKFLAQLLGDETAATAVEYGLIVALIVIAIISSVKSVASETNGLWAFVRTNVEESNN